LPKLVLGPLLRYLDETAATVWVETDSPCEVEVLGRTARTFRVEGHHYALVVIEGLEPGSTQPYEVALDGRCHWPPEDSDFPPSVIRTVDPDGRLKIVWGSCRVAVPHHPPYTLTKDEDDRGREIDALYALASRMREHDPADWPQLLFSLGDQVYADEDSPRTRDFIRARRDVSQEPHTEVADFEEYTRLYLESWGEPAIRWLLSTVATAMIFDDHDVHDDWNTSDRWLEEMRLKPWWDKRVRAALASYWVYQHLGNMSPAALAESDLFDRVRAAEDAGPLLHEFAGAADHATNGSRWSFARELGRTKVVVFDSREGRVLDRYPRKIVDDTEWKWVEEQATGDFDHLILADTLPVLMTPGEHYLEAWNAAVCGGAWGKRLCGLGERLRRALDLEHWPAFGDSFQRVVDLLRAVGGGRRGEPPATIVMLGGDVHHAFLAEVGFRPADGVRSAVYQAVCSPYRNALARHERMVVKAGTSGPLVPVMRALARSARVPEPEIDWRLPEGPTFDNQFATLEINGREALLRIEKVLPGNWRRPEIETSLERRLS
jgi:hypothetical protein